MTPTIIGYSYKANTFCPECLVNVLKKEGKIMKSFKVLNIEETLDVLSDAEGIPRDDEWEFDSDEFPKVIFDIDCDFGIDFCGECDILIK